VDFALLHDPDKLSEEQIEDLAGMVVIVLNLEPRLKAQLSDLTSVLAIMNKVKQSKRLRSLYLNLAGEGRHEQALGQDQLLE